MLPPGNSPEKEFLTHHTSIPLVSETQSVSEPAAVQLSILVLLLSRSYGGPGVRRLTTDPEALTLLQGIRVPTYKDVKAQVGRMISIRPGIISIRIIKRLKQARGSCAEWISLIKQPVPCPLKDISTWMYTVPSFTRNTFELQAFAEIIVAIYDKTKENNSTAATPRNSFKLLGTDLKVLFYDDTRLHYQKGTFVKLQARYLPNHAPGPKDRPGSPAISSILRARSMGSRTCTSAVICRTSESREPKLDHYK